MKNVLLILLVVGLFACKKESHVTKELKKAVGVHLATIAGDTVKINQYEVIRIDSVSEYRNLLSEIAKLKGSEKEYLDIMKAGKGNMNLAEMLLLNKHELDDLNAKLSVQFDTFRTAYYDVKTFISMTYRDSTIADTAVLRFNKNFTAK